MSLLDGADKPTRARIEALAAPITSALGVSLERMLGSERLARVVMARHRLHAAMFEAGFSLSEIALLLGRDHASVRTGVRKVLGPEGYRQVQIARAMARAS